MALKILCVHGVGRHPPGGAWEADWQRAIAEPLARIDPDLQLQVEFVHLDDIFEQFRIGPLDVLEALVKLGASGVGSLFRRPRDLGDQVRWTAGMVVQWVENDVLRQLTRERVSQRIQASQPDLIVAHSLGSLVCYDAFTSPGGDALVAGRRFVSAGSQIGNRFVVGNFAAGRLSALPGAEFWYHLFNDEDLVFTAEIRLSAPNFAQIDTHFDVGGPADHEITEYMRHPRTADTVWADAALALRRQPLARRAPAGSKAEQVRLARGPARVTRSPARRALLVGINEYADPSQNLAGCVNDVFLMSAMLQESGFAAEDIRIVLDHRATCAGVQDRLDWLLDGAGPGDTRFFYYSGHGARMPSYGPGERVDRVQEALVLHDFDWSAGRAFTDEQFHALYSHLPYELRFIAMFDCCHSGGLTRAGGRRVRGMDPPDDIRHRMLAWDAAREMWVPREIAQPNPGFDKKFNPDARTAGVHTTHRIGQAMSLRARAPDALKLRAAERGHQGPYLPVLIYASRDDQFAYEYQHGSIAHGAFTYSLVKTLRRDRRLKNPKLTFESLVDEVGEELKALGYEQQPSLVAPSAVAGLKVPLRP